MADSGGGTRINYFSVIMVIMVSLNKLNASGKTFGCMLGFRNENGSIFLEK